MWLRYDRRRMDLGLTDNVAIVTGSSRGLGLASAIALASEGCRVCICARGEARLRHAAAEGAAVERATDHVVAVTADVSTANGVQALVHRAVGAFAGIDILVK